MTDAFDLLILGSGSTAFAAALKAAELGKTAALTESRTVGGTCVNRGCLPSKNLIEGARVYWDAQRPGFPGLGGKTLDLDFGALVRGKDEVVHDYRGRKYDSMLKDSDKVKFYAGRATLTDPHTVDVDGRRVRGDQVLVATGSRPSTPNIPGLAEVPYLTSDLLAADESQELFDQPESLIVVGGGYIGLELGQLFQRLGTKVTLLQRSERLLPGHEPEVSIAVHDALRGEGMEIMTGANVRRVWAHDGGVTALVDQDGPDQAIHAARILVATGRTPNTDDLGLERAGVALDERGFVKVDETLRTNISHVWAAGDVIDAHTGSQMATPVGAHDGNIAAGNAFGAEPRRADHRILPRTIFTDPQVAVVGLTDDEAKERGYVCICNTISMHHVPRAGAIRDERGIIKMVLESDSEKVLGVSMVGRDAGEVIHEAAMGMRFGATVRDFIDMVHVYPSMAEALKIVAISFFKDVSQMSCCAE